LGVSPVEKLVSKFEKNATEEVRVQLREFRGHQLLDMRVFYFPTEGGEPRPTRKGIAISVGLISKLKDAITQAEKTLLEAEAKEKPEAGQAEAKGDDQAKSP